MPKLKTVVALSLPGVAMLLSTQLASADQLIAYLQAASLPDGATSYDCAPGQVTSNGKRAHMQVRAEGLTFSTTEVVYSTQAGTSSSTSVGASQGRKHRATLQSHKIDPSTGTQSVVNYCQGSWTTGWASSGTTNISQCSTNVTSSINQNDGQGSCFLRRYGAASFGNNNP